MTVRYQLEKNAKRAQFEADKLRRVNRVRSEVERARREIKVQTTALGNKALELADLGQTLSQPLQEIIDLIVALRIEIADNQEVIKGIRAEPWVPPPPPPPPTPKPEEQVVEDPEPRPTKRDPVAVASKREQVLDRLHFYIETDDSISKCPNCHAVLETEVAVCKNCGFRLKPTDSG